MPGRNLSERGRFEREWLERRAEERAAWGAWSAYVRNQNFRQELAQKKSPEERKAFIEEAKRRNGEGFWVG